MKNPTVTLAQLAKMRRSAATMLAAGKYDYDIDKILKRAARDAGFRHYGVSSFTCGRRGSNYTHLNVGDPYEPTLAYHEEAEKFRALPGGWGPVVEKADAYLCGYCGERPHRKGKSTCAHCDQYE